MKVLLAVLLAPSLTQALAVKTVTEVSMPTLRLDASAAVTRSVLPAFGGPSFLPAALSPIPSLIPTASHMPAAQSRPKTTEQVIATATKGFLPKLESVQAKDAGIGADFKASSVKFDGAMAVEGDVYEPLKDPVVPYMREDWNLNLDPTAFSVYTETARRHRQAFASGSDEEGQLSVQTVSLYHSMLASQGAWVVPTAFRGLDGQPAVGVQILANSKGHRLNKLAARMPEVKVVYAPRVTAMNAAQFAIIGDQPYLFLPNLDLPFSAETIRHELRHYGFFRKLLQGKATFLNAYFTPKPGRTTAPDARAYAHYLAMEEIATYAQQVRDLARRQAKSPADAGAQELRTNLNVLMEVERIAEHIVATAFEQLPTAPLARNLIGEQAAFLEAELEGGRLAFVLPPGDIDRDDNRREAFRQRLLQWDSVLGDLKPALEGLSAAAAAAVTPTDWKIVAKKADALLKALRTAGSAK